MRLGPSCPIPGLCINLLASPGRGQADIKALTQDHRSIAALLGAKVRGEQSGSGEWDGGLNVGVAENTMKQTVPGPCFS